MPRASSLAAKLVKGYREDVLHPNRQLGPWTLRVDAVFLVLAGGSAMVAETIGHFFGVGPFAAAQGSPHTIGGFEAHGFAVLIGVLLLRGAIRADRQLWHAVGLSTHLFLATANVLFWSAFEQQNLVAVGYVTTALHFVFVIAHAFCWRLAQLTPQLQRQASQTPRPPSPS